MDRQHLFFLLTFLAIGAAALALWRLQRARPKILEAPSPSSPLAVSSAVASSGALTVPLSRGSEPVTKSGAIVLHGPRAIETATGMTRYPLVLVHGMFGFEAVRFGGQQHQYF